MIKIKSEKEVVLMRRAGKVAAAALALAGKMVAPGMTSKRIDRAVRDYIVSRGGVPTFLGYNGFPANSCISRNHTVIHGIPDDQKLLPGDIVSIDIGATVDGYVGDCADTFAAAPCDEETARLIRVTRESFFEGLKFAREGYRVSDISGAVQRHVQARGFSVVREYVGHGVGTRLHEPPEVPNYVSEPRRAADPRLVRGMTLAIEPMVNAGAAAIRVLPDGWSVVTADGRNSAHYENTILITAGDPEILTVGEGAP